MPFVDVSGASASFIHVDESRRGHATWWQHMATHGGENMKHQQSRTPRTPWARSARFEFMLILSRSTDDPSDHELWYWMILGDIFHGCKSAQEHTEARFLKYVLVTFGEKSHGFWSAFIHIPQCSPSERAWKSQTSLSCFMKDPERHWHVMSTCEVSMALWAFHGPKNAKEPPNVGARRNLGAIKKLPLHTPTLCIPEMRFFSSWFLPKNVNNLT